MPVAGDVLEALDREVARRLPLWRRLNAAQLLAGSFLLLVFFGTLLLLILPGIYTGPRLSFVDALFTATSAVCVTGLIVVDTATYFTPIGQGVIAGLIQLGGLGILTVTTVIILWLGGRITLRSEAVVGPGEAGIYLDAGRLVRAILRYTFLIEFAGAALLWLAWSPTLGPIEAVWPAVFHAISAFCNAGFSTFSESLVPYAANPVILGVIMALIVLGGIGFLAMEELYRWSRNRSPANRLSLHTRLVLVVTGVLIVAGAVIFLFLEWFNVLAEFPWYIRPLEALFLSVTPRTAGFNTVDYSQLTSASLFLTMILMMIGGSPGSTAGGIKTTTVGVLVALVVARLRGRIVTHAFGRTIPETTVQRSTGLVVFAVVLVGVAVLLLQITELGAMPTTLARGAFLDLAFEVVSALNTVGLSTGITADVSPIGKVILSVLMFVGRVGPLTLAATMTLAAQEARVRLRYASEDVIIG